MIAPDLPPNISNKERLELKSIQERIERELKPLLKFLSDPKVTNIHANPDGSVFVGKLGHPKDEMIGNLLPRVRESVIKAVASFNKATVTKDSATISGEFPLMGARFTGVLPPLAKPGPGFALRKKAVRIFTFQDYLDTEIITEKHVDLLDQAILNYENIIVAGATDSGKTTFINAILDRIKTLTPDDRVIICEDTDEIQSSITDTFKMISTEKNPLSKCIEISLRLSPKRLFIGEIRLPDQILQAFQGWNSGHKGGASSIHSNSAKDTIGRIEDLCLSAFKSRHQRPIARCIDKILFFEKIDGQRKLTQFYELCGFDFKTETYDVKNLLTGHEEFF